MTRPALFVILMAVLAAACSDKPAADSAAPTTAATTTAGQAQGAGAPATPSAQAAPQSFTGTVVETMNASSYTYVLVKTPQGDLWAASGQFPVAVGDTVTVPIETPMENFRSETLKRDFPVIYFASRISKAGEPVAAPGQVPAMAASHGGSQPAGHAMGGMMGQSSRPAPVVTRMPPPDGGHSVADVWAKKGALAGKPVTVRGTVVKFNGGILGRNWVHIQDGSGKPEDGTNDLTITCDAVVAVGDVVLVTGTLAIDKDFTAGYVYPVIVESAKVTLQKK